MILQRVLGGAMACSAKTHAPVRTAACVTLSTGLANVDWAGLDPAVTQVPSHATDTTENEENNNMFMGN